MFTYLITILKYTFNVFWMMCLKSAEAEQLLLFFVLNCIFCILDCSCLLVNSCMVYDYKEVFQNLAWPKSASIMIIRY